MPYIAVVVPLIPEAGKDEFLAAWPKIAAEMKALPMVMGVSAGPIVGEDGEPVTGFNFIQTIAFATKEDGQAFVNSDWAKARKTEAEARGIAPPHHTTFEVPKFSKDRSPKAYTQFSRIIVKDDAAHKAWLDLCSLIGKETMGGVSIGGGEKVGMGIIGWDSLEEALAVRSIPGAKEAWEKYHSFGDCKGVMAQMEVY